MIAALKGCDCVCGTRVASRKQGDSFVRRVSSRIANAVRNRALGEDFSDAGCCYRVFKRQCLADLKFFKGIHRFLPTLFRLEGYSVIEVPIRQNPRAAGRGHYGIWNRVFVTSSDLLAVRWMRKRMFKDKIAQTIN